ncbi:MAG: DnaA regulatory inactivator Hda [Gammaproteobacteria bacterium]|nr:DnaA regulatory inactivator Hda [Gammaproteobacteria bacterium]
MAEQLPLAVGLEDNARFSTFFAGPNEIAVRHLMSLVRERVPVTWIWGPQGSGKSHLLQAVSAEAAEQGLMTSYVPLGNAQASQPAILENCVDRDLVCIDDLQVAAGSDAWELALFELFNGLNENGGALLVAANASPQETPIGLEDLASRLSWGPTFRLLALSDGERIKALRLRARHRGLELPDEVGDWLIKRVPRDMNSLYRLLDALDTESLAAGRRLTVPFVRGIFDKQQSS